MGLWRCERCLASGGRSRLPTKSAGDAACKGRSSSLTDLLEQAQLRGRVLAVFAVQGTMPSAGRLRCGGYGAKNLYGSRPGVLATAPVGAPKP